MASFDENGKYIKTNWKAGDKITATKLNKIEESIEAVNDNDISRHVEADARLDALEAKDVAHDKEFTNVKNLIADNKAAAELGDYDINSRMTFLENELNEGIEEVHNVAETVDGKINAAQADMAAQVNQGKADMETMVAEVEADLEGLHAKDEELSEQLVYNTNSNFVDIRSYGAISETDCTEIIQKVVNENKKVLITDGVYYIDPTKPIILRSGNILCIDDTAILKSIGVSSSDYQIIAIHDVSNVKVFGGGQIIGDVDEHIGDTGEHGMGISIRGANNCEISDLDISKCWGDGVYLGASDTGGQNYSEFITVRNLRIKECRRQGISIISVKNTLIENMDIKDIAGTDPQDGIDIEPNNSAEFLQNLTIKNILTQNCAGSGIKFYAGAYKDSPNVVNIKIENHTDIGSTYGFRARETMLTTKGIIELKDCRWLNSGSHCFHIQSWSADNVKIKVIRPTVQVSDTTNYGYWISTQNSETNSELVIGGVSLHEPNIIVVDDIIPERGIYIDIAKAKAIKNIEIINPIQLFGSLGNTELALNGSCTNVNILDNRNILSYTITEGSSDQYAYNQYRTKKKIISQNPGTCININSLQKGHELEIVNDCSGNLFVRFYNSTVDYLILPINTKMAPIRTTTKGSSIVIKRLEDGNVLITNIVGNWEEVQ